MQLVPRTNAISRVSPNARNQLHLSAIPCYTIYALSPSLSLDVYVSLAGTSCRHHMPMSWLGKMQITSRSKSQPPPPSALVFDTPLSKQAEQCKHFTVSQAQSQCARKVNFSASIAARTPTCPPPALLALPPLFPTFPALLLPDELASGSQSLRPHSAGHDNKLATHSRNVPVWQLCVCVCRKGGEKGSRVSRCLRCANSWLYFLV